VSQPLQAGDPAPAFELPTTRGGPACLSDFAGRFLVVFFYPKDDTEVCTREAVAFSGVWSRFSRRKTELLGISRDSVETHKAFIKNHSLTVRLGSDEDGTVCNAYGVWAEKQLYGRRYMGVVRTTFLVGPEGAIRRVWRNVRVPGHAEAVLAELSAST
jgi:thioredoxin-dependent peroxiredoxin